MCSTRGLTGACAAPPAAHVRSGAHCARRAHLNHVFASSEDGETFLYRSARDLNAVLKVRRADGKLVWVLGGEHGDFAVDRLRIRGCEVAVVADRAGRRYARGCVGLCVYVEGALAASVAPPPTPPASLTVQLACRNYR